MHHGSIEMLDNEKLDAIHICLPHYIHCKIAAEAMAEKYGCKAYTDYIEMLDNQTKIV